MALPTLETTRYDVADGIEQVGELTEEVAAAGRTLASARNMHDQRIVRTTPRDHLDGIDLWLGDSVGRWEGGTLVVDTH